MEAIGSKHFIVGTALETSATVFGSGFTTTEVGLFEYDAAMVNAGAAPTYKGLLQYVQKQTVDSYNQFPRRTPAFLAKDIFRITKKTYQAPVAQVTYVGYNGTSGSISYACDTDYCLGFDIYSPYIRKSYNNLGLRQNYNIHTACCDDCDGCTTTACYAETWKYIAQIDKMIVPTNNFSGAFGINQFIGAEMVLDNVAGDLATSYAIVTATFVNGSPVVNFSGNITMATGTYIRINAASNGGVQPTATDPVYKILTGVTAGTSIILDAPWQNASGTRLVTATTATSEIELVATATVTKCGIKLTGKFYSPKTGCCCFAPFPWDVEGVTFIVNDCNTNTCDNYTVTYTTNLAMEQNSARQLVYEEMEALGYSDVREFYRDCADNTTYSSFVDTTVNYDVIVLYIKSKEAQGWAGSQNDNEYIIELATPTSGNIAAFTTQVNALATIAGVPGV